MSAAKPTCTSRTPGTRQPVPTVAPLVPPAPPTRAALMERIASRALSLDDIVIVGRHGTDPLVLSGAELGHLPSLCEAHGSRLQHGRRGPRARGRIQ